MTRPLEYLSNIQRRCLIDATISPLVGYRRGYANSKAGPFYNLRTVHGLIERGVLRVVRDRGGAHYLRLTARAA